jgi:hypothetical protein
MTPEAVVSCPFIIFILASHHTTNSVHKFFNHKYICFSKATRFELFGHVQGDQILLGAPLHGTEISPKLETGCKRSNVLRIFTHRKSVRVRQNENLLAKRTEFLIQNM